MMQDTSPTFSLHLLPSALLQSHAATINLNLTLLLADANVESNPHNLHSRRVSSTGESVDKYCSTSSLHTWQKLKVSRIKCPPRGPWNLNSTTCFCFLLSLSLPIACERYQNEDKC